MLDVEMVKTLAPLTLSVTLPVRSAPVTLKVAVAVPPTLALMFRLVGVTVRVGVAAGESSFRVTLCSLLQELEVPSV